MRKSLLVAWDEYRRHVFHKRFLLGLMSVPVIILVTVGLIFLVFAIQNDINAVGYVDEAGILANPLPAPPVEPPDKPVPMLAYASEEQARSALDADDIQVYFLVPQDYLSSGKLTVVSYNEARWTALGQFYDFLSVNLLRHYDPVVTERLLEGAELTTVSLDGSRSASEKQWFAILLPMIAGILFMVIMFSTGGYLMQAVVEEKENRTMEVIVTSLSPNQFMAGKIIGDIAIGMTQVLSWGVFIFAGYLYLHSKFEVFRNVQISSQVWLLLLTVMLPAFVMVAALMAAVGATITEAREGQQVTSIIALPVWIPYILMGLILQNPNAPAAVALSMLPLTAPMTMFMRVGLTILPAWQIALSSTVQVLSAVAAIWLAGRAFRLGMLRYGKRLKWREIFTRNPRRLAVK